MNKRRRKRLQKDTSKSGRKFTQFEKRCKKRDNTIYPEELWNVHNSIAQFALPRLKEFRKGALNPNTCQGNACFPRDVVEASEFDNDFDLWISYLDKMIWSFEFAIWETTGSNNGIEFDFDTLYDIECGSEFDLEKYKAFYGKMDVRFQEGMKTFSENFMGLWW